MKKKLLILSAGLLFGVTSLAACNGNNPGASSDASGSDAGSSESSLSSSEEKVAGRILIAEDEDTAEEIGKTVLPKDINLDQEVNLEDHVVVTKVSSWSIESKSENVEINGHTFKAVGYGEYTVTIIAGTARRAINGHVVTPAKAKFNGVFDALALDYVATSSFTGMEIVKENYWLDIESVNQTTGAIVFRGAINEKATPNIGYTFHLDGAEDSQGNLYLGDAIEMQPGYGKSVSRRGFGAEFGSVKGSDFVQQFDSDGDPTGWHILVDSEADEDGTTIVSRFIQSVFGEDVWGNVVSYAADSLDDENAKISLAARYVAGTNTLSFYPCTEAGVRIQSFTSGTSSYTFEMSISGFGESAIDPCEVWLENPVIPTQYDMSGVYTVLDAIGTGKAYTMNAFGQWYNVATGADEETPENMHFSDTKEALMGNFAAESYANANIVESHFSKVDADLAMFYEDTPRPEVGSSTLSFVSDTNFCSASTSKVDDAWVWGDVSAETGGFEEGNTIWDSVMVPYIFVNASETDSLFSLASWYKLEEDTEAGTKTYYYNTYGLDMEVGPSVYQRGMPFYTLRSIPGYMGYLLPFYASYLGWWDYFTFTLEVSANSVTWMMDFDYTDELHYRMGYTLSDFGVDNVSEGAKEVYNNYLGIA